MKNNPKKREIAVAAFELFDKKGFHGTGINEIIEAAGIPKGTFYHYYNSKEEVALEVLSYYREKITLAMDVILCDYSKDPLDRIFSLYAQYIESYIKKSEMPYSNFASKMSQEAGEEHPRIKDQANNVFFDIRESISECIKEAQGFGIIDLSFDSRMLAEMIIYCWEGALLRMRGTQSVEPLFIFEDIMKNLFLNARSKM